MRFLSPSSPQPDAISQNESPVSPTQVKEDLKLSAVHHEHIETEHAKWEVSKTGDGDVAMGLFRSPTEVHDPIDPAEEAEVVRKIDFMILPYLSVCYAFFYIDKTTLSYAAIFGIRDDLHLVGTQYSWLSSIFYFGFLACKSFALDVTYGVLTSTGALPTNFMLQRFPVGKYLGINIFMWGVLLMCQAAAKVGDLPCVVLSRSTY